MALEEDFTTQIFNNSQPQFLETAGPYSFQVSFVVPKEWHGGVNCNKGFYFVEINGRHQKVNIIEAILYFIARHLRLPFSTVDELYAVRDLVKDIGFEYVPDGEEGDGVPATLKMKYTLKNDGEI